MRLFSPAFTFLVLISSVHTGLSQTIANLKYIMQVDRDEIKYMISYDFQSRFDNIPSRVKVKLTAEINGVSTSFYLKEVSGDVGDLIYPGINKQIIWNSQEELIHFSGDVNLVLENEPSVFISKRVKRGREVGITLSPNFGANKEYTIKLFRQGKEIIQLANDPVKDGSVSVFIPKKSKVRSQYQLAIQDGDKKYFSNSFKVRRKVSLGWVIVPAIGVSTYLMIDKILKDNEPLPGPPGSGLPD